MYIKAFYLGWKTRLILQSQKIQNMKLQVKDLQDYYRNNESVNANKDIHLLRARQTYITAVKGILIDKKWYSKVTEGEGERLARIERMKNKFQRIKGATKDT